MMWMPVVAFILGLCLMTGDQTFNMGGLMVIAAMFASALIRWIERNER